MFAVSRKRGAAIAALLAVVLLLGGCGKAAGGDTVDVDGVSDGTSATNNGDKDTDAKTKTDDDGNVTVEGGGAKVKVDGDNVEVKINGDDVKIDGVKPGDLDLCDNLPNKQVDMPEGYVPYGPPRSGDYKTGMFTCVKIADVMKDKASKHPGADPAQLEKQILDEVNESLREAGVTVTAK